MDIHPLYLAVGWIVVATFGATVAISLLALSNKITIEPRYRPLLFAKVILETTAAALFLFYQGTREVEPYDIQGMWKYTFTSATNVVGGYCTISKKQQPGDVVWALTGVRLWHKDGEGPAKNYAQPLNWSSDWAHILNQDDLKFLSHVQTEKGEIHGLGEARIIAKNRVGTQIVGTFSQLAPLGTRFGQLSLERIKDLKEAQAPEALVTLR